MLRFWQEMDADAFRALPAETVAILPVAATEHHGPHLPAGTDTMIVDGVLRTAAALGGAPRAVALPLQPVGWSVEHGDRPGTLSLPAELLAAAWTELGAWVRRAGLTRMVILNGHGGNPPPVAIAAMRLRSEQGMRVVTTHWSALARTKELAPAGAPARDWHAGWSETSVMLHLHPALVRREAAVPAPMHHPVGLPPDGPAPWAWMATDLNPTGVIGDATLADAAIGARLIGRAAAGLLALVETLSRTDP